MISGVSSATSGIASTAHIRRIYSQSADHFETTLAFCVDLSLCNVATGSINLSATGVYITTMCTNPDDFFLYILGLLVEGRNRFARHLRMFLRCFSPKNGSLCWLPTPEQRGLYSDVRNFLMEGNALVPTSDEQAEALLDRGDGGLERDRAWAAGVADLYPLTLHFPDDARVATIAGQWRRRSDGTIEAVFNTQQELAWALVAVGYDRPEVMEAL